MLFFSVKWFLFCEQVRVCWRYYRVVRFALADLLLGCSSLFYNAYRFCRKRGEVYGETPLTTLHQMIQRLGLESTDCWVDIGAGRGKGAFWVATSIGCRVIALEKFSFFGQIARSIIRCLRVANLDWRCMDASQFDYSTATAVYFYGSSWSEKSWSEISERLRLLPPGARVISVSAPIGGDFLNLQEEFPVRFPWGKTIAYLHVVSAPVLFPS